MLLRLIEDAHWSLNYTAPVLLRLIEGVLDEVKTVSDFPRIRDFVQIEVLHRAYLFVCLERL